MTARQPNLFRRLALFVSEVRVEMDAISAERKAVLELIAEFIRERTSDGEAAKLVFICTHNSRRSQMAQIWARAAAHVFEVPGVETYSGGTEATAFNPRAVAAMRRAGFRIDVPDGGDNPVYRVRFADGGEPMECFSKVYLEPPNPSRDFCAVMTCSAADAACPIVRGATERISLPYDDPGILDGSDREAATYDERCRRIAREMLAIFSGVRV